MSPRSVAYILCYLLALAISPSDARDALGVQISGKVANGLYYVTAALPIVLSPEVEEAVKNGVPLQFVFDFRINRSRRYLWDEELLSVRRSCTLERHALANKYVVTDLITHRSTVAGSIAEALEMLGHLTEIPLGKAQRLITVPPLIGTARGQLNIEALPAPLRPIAYLTPSWHLKSPRLKWQVLP